MPFHRAGGTAWLIPTTATNQDIKSYFGQCVQRFSGNRRLDDRKIAAATAICAEGGRMRWPWRR